jgi:hypothetical protein
MPTAERTRASAEKMLRRSMVKRCVEIERIMLADTNCLMIIPSISFGRAPSAAGYRTSFLSMKSGSF